MLKMSRRISSSLLLCALALVVAVPGASANKPEPCGSFLITDPAGDQAHRQQGQPVMAMPPSTDVLGVFFRVDGGKVTANLALTEVPEAPPAGYAAIRYRMYFTKGGTVRYLQVLITASGPKFSHGQQFEAVYEHVGDTTGAVFPGPNGVVQAVIPADIGGTPGTQLGATSGTAGLLTAEAPPQAQLAPVYLQADTAPDDSGDGPGTTPQECPAVAPVDPGPSGGTTTNPQPTEVAISFAKAAALSAKKVNKKRSASFSLKTTAPVTDVALTLKKGAKALGSAKLTRLDGQATVKIKLKKKLKKGAHSLVVSAKRSDGSTYSVTLKVKVSK